MDNEELNTSVEYTNEEGINGENIEDEQSEIETPAERKAREEREERERAFRAKKRKLIPPFVMLTAGAATSITMRILHYEMKTMLIILLCVLIGFYIAGCIIKEMLDRFERQIEEAEMDKGGVIEKELAEEDRPTRRRSEAKVKDE
ncbi:MAG: hypothetical protein K2K07_00120 [Lachnospiraceae bacterium]|nr:hypothetical protein [Lachnospiraceae bacterium]